MQNTIIPFSLSEFENFFIKFFSNIIENISILSFGETLHSSEEIFEIRNKIFKILVEKYGFSAIAIESSFPHSKIINDYINNQSLVTYQEIMDIGINNGFGRFKANEDLLNWLKEYNSKPENKRKIYFYGCDIPGKNYGPAAPHFLINLILDYFKKYDEQIYNKYKNKIYDLLNSEEVWESYEALTNPSKAYGFTDNALKLKVEINNILIELKRNKFEYIKKSGKFLYDEILHLAIITNEHLNYHTAIAQAAGYEFLLAYRDFLISENIKYIFNKEHERTKGKLFIFMHNAHIQKGKVFMPIGSTNCEWWPAGSYINEKFNEQYLSIGSAIGLCDEYVPDIPDDNTYEKYFLNLNLPFFAFQTKKLKEKLDLTQFKVRAFSAKNPSYKPLSSQSFSDFDFIFFINKITPAKKI
ncbi:MAG TPA: erythromycin esterase family protein [bacterium]|nr:erythromycin esterase family protein [bacterium]